MFAIKYNILSLRILLMNMTDIDKHDKCYKFEQLKSCDGQSKKMFIYL